MNLEPIRALLELLKGEDGEHGSRCASRDDNSCNCGHTDKFLRISNTIPALSQLLEAVTNLEKLEAEWRDGLPGMSDGEREIYTAYRKGCADDLKRLLHPEDTK